MATAAVETNPNVCMYVLACRFASYTVQYISQCKSVKNLLQIPTGAENRTEFDRVILRGNRMASHLKQERDFESIGVLGSGSFGTVELVRCRSNQKFYALKTVKAKFTSPISLFNLVALVERDCAIALESGCFVKLKAAWVERNQDSGDSFKFLSEKMIYGDMRGLIKQLHPYTTANGFSRHHKGIPLFSFTEGTYDQMMEGVDLDAQFGWVDTLLIRMFVERMLIYHGNHHRVFT